MSELIAIGIGCKKGCASDDIVALVMRAVLQLGTSSVDARLFSIEAKRDEVGLREAARALALPLQYFSAERLALESSRLLTRSAATRARFGIDSVAEAAALAGAGFGSKLVAPRLAQNGATCAIAVGVGAQ